MKRENIHIRFESVSILSIFQRSIYGVGIHVLGDSITVENGKSVKYEIQLCVLNFHPLIILAVKMMPLGSFRKVLLKKEKRRKKSPPK